LFHLITLYNKSKLLLIKYYISLSHKRTSINNIVFIQQVNKTIKEILGEGYSSHSFRQGLITEMGSKSINIKIISQFVGHKNVSTTMGYTSLLMSK